MLGSKEGQLKETGAKTAHLRQRLNLEVFKWAVNLIIYRKKINLEIWLISLLL